MEVRYVCGRLLVARHGRAVGAMFAALETVVLERLAGSLDVLVRDDIATEIWVVDLHAVELEDRRSEDGVSDLLVLEAGDYESAVIHFVQM
ncbi:uncharacterized protein BO72DRAFT_30013 [Aspergillus fijiensis CBS 313.89]|uniref:Uncharacterized protein n=1 Tax=Aspergillus fijiensis CBS 313.89 TaxID=1448319 RepID=A0A8G1RE52_9EURO|nr:uncharacterized protein BO72DRAFT_30013 [Aspergillus fijiensis CBS 313.89]RAK71113.1 hypothetical protein BO72DRAFT_30013 [Aspergillus fijiensis CBS 313.89]